MLLWDIELSPGGQVLLSAPVYAPNGNILVASWKIAEWEEAYATHAVTPGGQKVWQTGNPEHAYVAQIADADGRVVAPRFVTGEGYLVVDILQSNGQLAAAVTGCGISNGVSIGGPGLIYSAGDNLCLIGQK